MLKGIESYCTLVFDCDGVILNSNKVKTQAFYNAALPYGAAAAQALVDYHVANGGISRYLKFQYLLDEIVVEESGPGLDALLQAYASEVRKELMACEITEGLYELREQTASSRWMVVSGGDQAELRDVFAARGLDQLFDGGIFGSPSTKDEIFAREIASGNIALPAVFIGDSKYDFESSSRAGLDFVFISNWSEVADWESWVRTNNIKVFDSLSALCG